MIIVAGREVPEIEHDSDFESRILYTLRYLLDNKVPTEFLADFIENKGIQVIDRYGRLRSADEVGTAQALNLLANIFTWSIGKEVVLDGQDWCSDVLSGIQDASIRENLRNDSHVREIPSPLEWTEDEFSDYDRFGWSDISSLSKWQYIRYEMQESTGISELEEISSRHKKSLLIVIAALCEKAKVSPMTRGLPMELERISQALGERLGNGTIREILNEVDDLFR